MRRDPVLRLARFLRQRLEQERLALARAQARLSACEGTLAALEERWASDGEPVEAAWLLPVASWRQRLLQELALAQERRRQALVERQRAADRLRARFRRAATVERLVTLLARAEAQAAERRQQAALDELSSQRAAARARTPSCPRGDDRRT